ncbi:hypothetical protein EFA46_007135 [Halarchaeum sp. CBA1220]|uniref:DUF7096 domain-containing protein n=1 Tax=Halarchaeum sp. CBA1220 TaxID=1853682 RepID=UPI0011CEA487|nr:hypothetical protein [Halarchaeum sp. CBA1220]QLC33985.1 hypothetical protein EFA46_007135 [Halarchaeum sp. CBA1220]
MAAQPGPSSTTTTASNASADAVAPGAQLAGAIGAQGATVDGALESRAFDHALAAMQSNASKARLVASRQAALSERVDALADRRAALVAAHRNGTLSDGAFAARMAALAARGQSASALADRAAAAADALPASARTSHGADPQALRATGARARSLANVTDLPGADAVVVGGPPGVVTPPTPPIATPGNANVTGANATGALERASSDDVAVGTGAVDATAADSDGNATATRTSTASPDDVPPTAVSAGDAVNETVTATRDGVLDAASNTTDADANETV